MSRDPPAIRQAFASRLPVAHVRISWMALTCVGFQPKDALYAPTGMEAMMEVAASAGVRCTGHPATATVVMQDRPREIDLLSHLSRLRPGNRLVVFNDEADIESMPERCFELVTACVFDHESHRVLRVFDGYRPRRVASYIDVELNDVSDASLCASAARIAALR